MSDEEQKVWLLAWTHFLELNPGKKFVLRIAELMQLLRLLNETPDHLFRYDATGTEFSRMTQWLVYKSTPRTLRLLADALEVTEQDMDGRRKAIYLAYFRAACLAFLDGERQPTLSEVAKMLEKDYRDEGKHISGLPVNFSLRKTLKRLNLPLAPDKRGRRRKK